jgi:hypothetical protein
MDRLGQFGRTHGYGIAGIVGTGLSITQWIQGEISQNRQEAENAREDERRHHELMNECRRDCQTAAAHGEDRAAARAKRDEYYHREQIEECRRIQQDLREENRELERQLYSARAR